jgi:hypothetical protein
MTTITYRQAAKGHSSSSFGIELFTLLSAYSLKLAERLEQWQAAREIESMSIDMRKDLGWPAADITRDSK